jgi:flagellar motility protein MotE (MotC chaperone)
MVLAGTAAELTASSIRLLDDALRLPPAQLGQEVDEAEREIARLRDALIAQLRAHQAANETELRSTLDRVNAALSLVVSVEYPSAGIQRSALEQARDTLARIAASSSVN